MKKGLLIMLLVFLLSFSAALATAGDLNGPINSQENILLIPLVEIQAVTAPDFGGIAALSVSYSEPVETEYLYNNTKILANIGRKMDNIVKPTTIKAGFAQLTDKEITVYKTEFG